MEIDEDFQDMQSIEFANWIVEESKTGVKIPKEMFERLAATHRDTRSEEVAR